MANKMVEMYRRPGQDAQAENNIFVDIFTGSLDENMKFYYQEIDRQALEIQEGLVGLFNDEIYDLIVFFNAAYLSRNSSEAISRLFRAASRKCYSQKLYYEASDQL